MMRVQSFSLRLTLTYLALFLVSLALILGTYFTLSVTFPHRALKADIARELRRLEQIYAVEGEGALESALKSRAAVRTDRSAFHVFIGPDGRVRTANIPTWPETRGPMWLSLEADLYAGGDEYDRLALMKDVGFANGARLMLGRDVEDLEELQDHLEIAAIWFFAAAIVLGLAGGFLISRAIGKRIDRISGAAMQVMAGDLTGRVPVDGSNDDFDRLSQNLNRMLQRIEELFASVRRVSDNVAHELRTPLTRLLADVSHLEEQASTAVEPLVARIGEEAHRLQRIFESLLRISRIEAGRYELAKVPVNSAELLHDLQELYLPAVEDAGGRLEIARTLDQAIMGDRDLLFQALTNLLDNALKYGGPTPRIALAAYVENGVSCLAVTNAGGNFDEETASRASERFFRGSNAEGEPGEGLGLALVEAIAKAHGGKFSLSRQDETIVALVSLVLPDQMHVIEK